MRAFSHSKDGDPSAIKQMNLLNLTRSSSGEMGWLTGIEPATTGITILGSTN